MSEPEPTQKIEPQLAQTHEPLDFELSEPEEYMSVDKGKWLMEECDVYLPVFDSQVSMNDFGPTEGSTQNVGFDIPLSTLEPIFGIDDLHAEEEYHSVGYSDSDIVDDRQNNGFEKWDWARYEAEEEACNSSENSSDDSSDSNYEGIDESSVESNYESDSNYESSDVDVEGEGEHVDFKVFTKETENVYKEDDGSENNENS